MTLVDDPLFKEPLDMFLGLMVLARGYPPERLIYGNIVCSEYLLLHGLGVTQFIIIDYEHVLVLGQKVVQLGLLLWGTVTREGRA